MKSIFDCTSPPDMERYFELCKAANPSLDVTKLRRLALQSVRYYKGDSEIREEMRESQALEARWYRSLVDGSPDYGVYSDDAFLSEAWACWLCYSRGYATALRSLHIPFCSAVDLGCGHGYTTAAIKEIRPEADVAGTNVETSMQFHVATAVGRERGFAVFPSVSCAGRRDLVFASEYFEHFPQPVHHLLEVLRECAPNFLLIANSFGSVSVGHFNSYDDGEGKMVSNKKIGRAFNQALRDKGYVMLETGFWNNRPAAWKKAP